MTDIIFRHLGRQDYLPTYEAMKKFSAERTNETPDEIWVLEHPPIYTLGQAGDPSHLLKPNEEIPLIATDRGGQITYHGPGQIIVYLLLDLRRRHLFVRDLVVRIEQAIINTLFDLGLNGERRLGAPGIYLSEQNSIPQEYVGAKIAALGLKIAKQSSYHGLALNVNMDLSPFSAINPCGYEGLKTVDLNSLGVSDNSDTVTQYLLSHLSQQLEVQG
jgi:lipoyl(octanoyl) transferase